MAAGKQSDLEPSQRFRVTGKTSRIGRAPDYTLEVVGGGHEPRVGDILRPAPLYPVQERIHHATIHQQDQTSACTPGDSNASGAGDQPGSSASGAGAKDGKEAPFPDMTTEDALGVVVTASGARYEDIDWPVAISSGLSQAQRGGLAGYELMLEALGVLIGLPHGQRMSVEEVLESWPDTAIKNQVIGYLKGKATAARDEEANAPDLKGKQALNSKATRFELAAEALAEE